MPLYFLHKIDKCSHFVRERARARQPYVAHVHWSGRVRAVPPDRRPYVIMAVRFERHWSE